ncbi:hypothetical protein RRG08_012918 [Elysia crispata]|uniref:Uncharacterized protein n=1 Tax=Elysia crispata TaxID=231223 RepID=A0AAE1A0G3_9GAST|nr:hypothetical protein RRG08_012918 [Elysia crispata]
MKSPLLKAALRVSSSVFIFWLKDEIAFHYNIKSRKKRESMEIKEAVRGWLVSQVTLPRLSLPLTELTCCNKCNGTAVSVTSVVTLLTIVKYARCFHKITDYCLYFLERKKKGVG